MSQMKYNRTIDENIIEQSKQRTMNFVMENLHQKRKKVQINSRWMGLMLTAALAVVLVLFLVSPPQTPTPEPVTLNQFNTERLVETTYLSGSIIVSALETSTQLNYMPLVALLNDEETAFEANLDRINKYFDMLKVFIDQDALSDAVTIETLDSGDYAYKMTYTIDRINYVFFININETEITGLLQLKNLDLVINGSIEETEDEYQLELEATSGDNYIRIEYQSETKDEIEKSYEVEEYINGVLTEKEINIEFDGEETSVEISEGENEYLLERFSSNGVTTYYLEYRVGETEGEAYITETVNSLGQTIYHYDIDEDGIEKEIEVEDPDDDDEREEEEEREREELEEEQDELEEQEEEEEELEEQEEEEEEKSDEEQDVEDEDLDTEEDVEDDLFYHQNTFSQKI